MKWILYAQTLDVRSIIQQMMLGLIAILVLRCQVEGGRHLLSDKANNGQDTCQTCYSTSECFVFPVIYI